MSLLLETIKIWNGVALNLPLHLKRMARARKELFGMADDAGLEHLLTLPPGVHEEIVRCRVIYDTEIREIGFIPYVPALVRSLHIVHANHLDYAHKYLDRDALNALVDKAKADDVLIVKNGWVTDCTIANLVFTDGEKNYTPSTPLLRGTQRDLLIQKGIIEETEIRVEDIARFTHFKLVNALLEFDGEWLETGRVLV